MTELVVRQLGTFVNAATILVVALLLIWFGLRPATRAILTPPAPRVAEAPALPDGVREEAAGAIEHEDMAEIAYSDEGSLIDDLTTQYKRSPRKKLEQMVRFNDEQSAAILKRWIHEGART
jgi:flagellar M-ring protein FliF